MIQTSDRFKEHVARALTDTDLKVALNRTTSLLQTRRKQVVEEYAEYDEARNRAQAIKDHTLKHMAHYLEMFEANATAQGAVVHWAKTPDEARRIVADICVTAEAKTATRVKSMLGEEIGIGDALKDAGVERIETDLAEHIIQLAEDPPSHIVMPAMHKTHEQVATLFDDKHGIAPDSHEIPDLVASARRELRQKFLTADVGISGANFLIAETGAIVTVTNEGNSELTCTPPKVHIVTAGIEKIIPGMDHASVFLRLLSRAAIGAEITQYTTFYNGPKRDGDADGPQQYHIVRVDNHRTDMLGSDLQPMLRCIRCGACMNHCPVYAAVGGHAYGAVYPGPMGSVLTPALSSLEAAKDLPNACTLNGRCKEVCPVNIPPAGYAAHAAGPTMGRQTGVACHQNRTGWVGISGTAAQAVSSGCRYCRAWNAGLGLWAQTNQTDAVRRGLGQTPRPAAPGKGQLYAAIQRLQTRDRKKKIMSDRATILQSVRSASRALDTSAADIAAEATALVADRTGVQPGFDGADLIDRFVAKATSERVTATVDQVGAMADVPGAVQAYLARVHRSGAICVQNSADLNDLNWDGIERGAQLDTDGGCAVTCAEYGIAETGSVVFRSGADQPILMNFLPLHHIVVLRTSTLLAYPEDLWPHLGGPDAPQSRLLTIVTGTSGTADIEARNVRGAHGPKHMHIVMVAD